MSDTLDKLAEAAYLACCALAPAPPKPTPWAELDVLPFETEGEG